MRQAENGDGRQRQNDIVMALLIKPHNGNHRGNGVPEQPVIIQLFAEHPGRSSQQNHTAHSDIQQENHLGGDTKAQQKVEQPIIRGIIAQPLVHDICQHGDGAAFGQNGRQ